MELDSHIRILVGKLLYNSFPVQNGRKQGASSKLILYFTSGKNYKERTRKLGGPENG